LRSRENQTLQVFLSDAFPISEWEIEAKEIRPHPSFAAALMVKMCRPKLE